MFELLFVIAILWVIGKLLFIGIKAAWSISKILVTIVLLPLGLVIMVLTGLMYIALPILLLIGIASLFITS